MFLEWQRDVILFFQQYQNAFTEVFFRFISFLGDPPFYLMLLGFFYWTYNKRAGEYLGFTLGVSVTINNILKGVFMLERPYIAHHEVKNIRDSIPTGSSFPSGHAQSSSTLFYSIARYFNHPLAWGIAVLIMALMMVSRMFLGMHYLQDVLIGALLGILLAVGFYKLFQHYEHDQGKLHRIYLLILLILAVPGIFLTHVSDFYRRFGILVAMVVSVIVEKRFINFTTRVEFPKKVFRFITGTGITVFSLTLIGVGLESLAVENDIIKNLFDFTHLFLGTMIGFTLFPYCFNRLNL